MNSAPIPLIDLGRAFASIRDEVRTAILGVLESQRFILGPEGEALEGEIAARTGAAAAVGVASGTDALLLAYRALRLAPGDEVVTSPFSFFASAGAVINAGGRPVFADIDPLTLNLDPEAAAASVTARTRAVCPVHLFGQPVDVEELRRALPRKDLFVLEDAAQAIGARVRNRPVGSLGDAAAFSFFPTKNLGGLGDAGMVVSTDDSFAARVRVLRHHGQTGAYEHTVVGTNSRLDELQAAALRVKLRRLDAWTEARRANARQLSDLLAASGIAVCRGGHLDGADLSLPVEVAGRSHVWNLYTVRVRRRDGLAEHLRARGIGCAVYYPLPLHRQPCLRDLGSGEGSFPEAEMASREVLSLPSFPGILPQELERVAAGVASFYGRPA